MEQQSFEIGTIRSMVCPECEGKGQVLDGPARVLDGRTYHAPCSLCDGKGRIVFDIDWAKARQAPGNTDL